MDLLYMHNHKILIIDDEPQNLLILINYLKNKKYIIKISNSGKESLDIINDFMPDIILLDIMMPEMDGFEVCSLLKENPKTKNIPVIFLTSLISTNDKIYGYKLGAVDYITKPFNIYELDARLNSHLTNLWLQKELLLARKFEAIGTLSAGISNEFNHLLTLIINYIDLAQKDKNISTNLNDILANIKKSSLKAADLIYKIFSAGAGIAPMMQKNTIKNLIKEIVKNELKNSTITYKLSVDNNLWPTNFDYLQMKICFTNLIKNSIEAMPDGGNLEISALNYEQKNEKQLDNINYNAGKYIKIIIKDNGIGISEDIVDKVIDPYFSTKNNAFKNGKGLGLSIAYSIVKHHNGFLIIQSKYLKGCEITIVLPAID